MEKAVGNLDKIRTCQVCLDRGQEMSFQITAEEAGRMVDYLDRRLREFQAKKTEIEAEISLNRDLRERYRNLWLSLEREERNR
jgi:hypothetical protein